MVRIFPIVIGGVVGAADGALAVSDTRNGRVTNSKEWSTWFEAAAFAGGLLGNLMRISPDITEPLTLGGVALLARRGAIAAMPAAPAALALPMARQYASARPWVVGAPGMQYAPAGTLG